MKMPRYLGPGLVRAALVAQDDAVDDHLLGDRAAPGAAGESVVIARDPDDARRRGLGLEPCRDGGNDARRRFAVVKTVAAAPDSLRPHFVRKPRQPVERAVAVIRRQRLARRGTEARQTGIAHAALPSLI